MTGMTEAEWLACAEPAKMLASLRGRASERKERLFCCACARRVIGRERQVAEAFRRYYGQPFDVADVDEDFALFRRAAAVAEQLAEGTAAEGEMAALLRLLRENPAVGEPADYDLCEAAQPEWAPFAAYEFMAQAVNLAVHSPPNGEAVATLTCRFMAAVEFLEAGPEAAAGAVAANKARFGALYATTFRYQTTVGGGEAQWYPNDDVEEADGYAVLAAHAAAEAWCCDLIREVFGDPSRAAALRLEPGWLVANDGAALALARQAYDQQDFAGLPVLADALEDAGCAEDAMLSHLRSAGPHVRGCWALDLILGK
jgi:hypothetical protein